MAMQRETDRQRAEAGGRVYRFRLRAGLRYWTGAPVRAADIRRGLDMARRAHGRGQRFFVTLLPIEPHEPYIYHAGVTEKYFPGPFDPPIGKSFSDLEHIHQLGMTPRRWDHLRGLYDGEVTFDVSMGQMLQPDGTRKPVILSTYFDGMTNQSTSPPVAAW